MRVLHLHIFSLHFQKRPKCRGHIPAGLTPWRCLLHDSHHCAHGLHHCVRWLRISFHLNDHISSVWFRTFDKHTNMLGFKHTNMLGFRSSMHSSTKHSNIYLSIHLAITLICIVCAPVPLCYMSLPYQENHSLPTRYRLPTTTKSLFPTNPASPMFSRN